METVLWQGCLQTQRYGELQQEVRLLPALCVCPQPPLPTKRGATDAVCSLLSRCTTTHDAGCLCTPSACDWHQGHWRQQ